MSRLSSALIVVLLLAARPAAPIGSPLDRVYLLSSGDRSSIVVDLDEMVPRPATPTRAADGSFVVDVGPVHGPIRTQTLHAAATSPVVREVNVRSVQDAHDQTFVRVQITVGRTVASGVRSEARRVYIDLTPVAAKAADAAATTAAGQTPGALGTRSKALEAPAAAKPAVASAIGADRTASPPPAPSVPGATTKSGGAPATQAPSGDPVLLAKQMAGRGDVKGLERLLETVGEAQRPDVSRYLEQARRSQLSSDAQMFSQLKTDEYSETIHQLLPELSEIDAALGQWSAGLSSRLNVSMAANAVLSRLRGLTPPAAQAASHQRLCDGLALAANALAGPSEAVAGDGPEPTLNADARASVLRAKSILDDAISRAN